MTWPQITDCPYCHSSLGPSAVEECHGTSYRVVCGCGAAGRWFETPVVAINRWNGVVESSGHLRSALDRAWAMMCESGVKGDIDFHYALEHILAERARCRAVIRALLADDDFATSPLMDHVPEDMRQ